MEGEFLLPTPSESDPSSVKFKVYMFGTPKFLQLTVSRTNIVGDVIRHIMTVYQKDKILS